MNNENLKRRAILMLQHMGNMHRANFQLYDLYAQSHPFSFSESEVISVVSDILGSNAYGISGRIQLDPRVLRFFADYLKGTPQEERDILLSLASYYENKEILDGLSSYTIDRYIKKRNKKHNTPWDAELNTFTEGTLEFHSYMICFPVRSHILSLFDGFPTLKNFINKYPVAASLILDGEFTLREYHQDIIAFHKSRDFSSFSLDVSFHDYYPEGALPTTGGYYLVNPEGTRWFTSFPPSCTNLRSDTTPLPHHLGLSGFFTVEDTNHIYIPQCGVSIDLHPEISIPHPPGMEIITVSSPTDLFLSDTDMVVYPVPASLPLKDYF